MTVESIVANSRYGVGNTLVLDSGRDADSFVGLCFASHKLYLGVGHILVV